MTSMQNIDSDRQDRISDDDDDEPTSGSEGYEEGDLLSAAMDDDVTAQLAAAGWQIKHANGDFHFFAFHLLSYLRSNHSHFTTERKSIEGCKIDTSSYRFKHR